MAEIIDLGAFRFVFRGAYSGSTAYDFNDVVSYNNNLFCYVTRGASTGTVPTDAAPWALMMQGPDITAVTAASSTAARTHTFLQMGT